MALKLYNTLTRQKAEFRPIDPNNVRMYVCGPTVYDYAHIGNARPVIVFDVLFRLLRHVYGEQHVTYVRNITDVDDKINARAARDFPDLPLNEAIRKVTTATEKQFHDDIAALGVLPPTYEPRATEHIADMINIVQALLDRGHAYVAAADDGHEVLFDIASMPDYGALSQRKLEEQIAGVRVEVDLHKRQPGDFVLWKASAPNEPSWPAEFRPDPAFRRDSKWNNNTITIAGRPGWHIECSAMSQHFLGDEFDLHGGGLDLIFPHHENEIAQSRCAHGTPVMANVWMHNGFLQVEGEKMSKSLGNFVTINELLKRWPGDVVRFQMLMGHYRQPIDWTSARCADGMRELFEWSEFIYRSFPDATAEPSSSVQSALSDDLNTPEAITALRSGYKLAISGDQKAAEEFARDLKFLGFKKLDQPGLFESAVTASSLGPAKFTQDIMLDVKCLRAASANNLPEVAQDLENRLKSVGIEVQRSNGGYYSLVGSDIEFTHKAKALVQARLEARKRKDFAESDRIRDELAKMGIALKDTKNKETGEIETTWEVMR